VLLDQQQKVVMLDDSRALAHEQTAILSKNFCMTEKRNLLVSEGRTPVQSAAEAVSRRLAGR
jgi:hypothetical protein